MRNALVVVVKRDQQGSRGDKWEDCNAARADPLFFLPAFISNGKLVLETMNEFGRGRGRVPTIGFGIAMFQADMRQTISLSPELAAAAPFWPKR